MGSLTAALWLDVETQTLWQGPGEAIGLSERPLLMSLARLLFESEVELTKEEICRALWPKLTYHPIRHDPRIRQAIGRFRRLLHSPRLLIYGASGFRLDGPRYLVLPKSR